MRAVITIRRTEHMTTAERRARGAAWIYEAVKAYGIRDLDPDDCPIARTEKGKPYFPSRPAVCFSVSHSGDYWACAVAVQPVGLDLQRHKGGRLKDIARRFFHPREAAWLEMQSEDAFFDVWAAKESYVKWTGQGIDRYFGVCSVVEEGRLADRVDDACFWRANWQGYSLCLCGGSPWEAVEILREDCGEGSV